MPERQIIKTPDAQFGEYFWDPDIRDITVLKLSYDRETEQGAYMIRMAPGSVTEIHTHQRREEYYIIQGDLIESDGTVLTPGDYVIYQPGTRHNSRSETGCLLIAIDYDFTDKSPASP